MTTENIRRFKEHICNPFITARIFTVFGQFIRGSNLPLYLIRQHLIFGQNSSNVDGNLWGVVKHPDLCLSYAFLSLPLFTCFVYLFVYSFCLLYLIFVCLSMCMSFVPKGNQFLQVIIFVLRFVFISIDFQDLVLFWGGVCEKIFESTASRIQKNDLSIRIHV